MNRLPGYTYRILRTLLLAVLLLAEVVPGVVWAQNGNVQIIPLRKIDDRDTLLCGVYRAEKQKQVKALIEKLTALWAQTPDEETIKGLEKDIKRLSDDGSKKRAQQEKEIRQRIAEIEKSPDSDFAATARATGETPGEVKRRNLERHRRDLDKLLKYDDAPRQKRLAEYQEALREAKSLSATPEDQYAVKRQIAALMVDGRLHNYVDMHDFRYGRAAVAIRERYYSKGEGVWTHRNVWGFVDEQMRLVIPCQYERVFDFNNYKSYRSQGVFEKFYDRDDRPWTTVYPKEYGGGMMGMIDRDGREVIPANFVAHEAHHSWIEFIKTPWGEFAPVTILRAKGKYVEGIIDRNGNYTLEPAYDHIVYYDDLQCFGTTGKNRIYFDPYGNRLSK